MFILKQLLSLQSLVSKLILGPLAVQHLHMLGDLRPGAKCLSYLICIHARAWSTDHPYILDTLDPTWVSHPCPLKESMWQKGAGSCFHLFFMWN